MVLVSLPVSQQDWMYEVLDCFDTIVLNAGNTFRLQEECAFHSCIKKEKKGEFIIVSFFLRMIRGMSLRFVFTDRNSSYFMLDCDFFN